MKSIVTVILTFLNLLSVLASYVHDEYGDPCMAAADQFDYDCKSALSNQDTLQKHLCSDEAYLTTVIGCIVLNAPNPILLDAAFKRLRKRCPKLPSNMTEYINRAPSLSMVNSSNYQNGFIIPSNLTQHNFHIRSVRLNDVKKAEKYS